MACVVGQLDFSHFFANRAMLHDKQGPNERNEETKGISVPILRSFLSTASMTVSSVLWFFVR